MFPQQPQQQFRTAGADVKLFYSGSTWAKPPGVSHIYMMLIGGGGDGDGTTGGGSGSVTVWYGAAQHVPNSLVVTASTGNNVPTTVQYRSANGLNVLLQANAGNGSTAGTASASNNFLASGFYQSTAGQNGSSLEIDASTSTFLSGGGPSSGFSVQNYGYRRLSAGDANGFFMLQPIIVGAGGKGSNSVGGIGCGSGTTGKGGPGMVLIASW